MTQQERDSIFDKFVADFNNKPIKIFPNNFPPQCFEEAVKFTDLLGVPHFPGNPSPFPYANAYEIYTKPNSVSSQYFDFLPNTATFIPQKGDTVVWAGSLNGGIGHVATATGKGDTNSFEAFSQNWPLGSNAHLMNFSYNHVLGVLRYKVSGATPPMDPVIQKKASRYDVLEHDDKGASIDTNKITDVEFEKTRQQFKDRKTAGGKWDVICDMINMPHTATALEVYNKINALGGCSPAELAKAKEEGRKQGRQEIKDIVKGLA